LADRDAFDLKRAARSGDAIEYFGQNKAVDHVSTDFDLFDMIVAVRGLGVWFEGVFIGHGPMYGEEIRFTASGVASGR